LSKDAKRKITTQAAPALGELFDNGKDSQAQVLSFLQGLLAISEGSALTKSWLQDLVSGRPTIYDKAMDAVYNATRIGGGDHRFYDGGHSLVGAFQAARDASPDDSIIEEAAGLLQALARDATTPRGLPLVTWEKDTFRSLTDSLGSVGIPRAWVRDLVSYDAAEVIGAELEQRRCRAVRPDHRWQGLVDSYWRESALLVVTVIALAKGYHTARRTGDWKEFADGLARGGVSAGAVILVTGMVGGPTVVVLLTGICVGVVAQRASQEVSIVEIGQWIAVQLRDARAGATPSICSS